MVRNMRDRLEKAAPFLAADTDPYLVIDDDGGLVWVQDMYTVTDRYPYSTPADSGAATASGLPATGRLNVRSGLPNDFNYIRNSVKVTIDAYDGDMVFYVIDAEDPVLGAYRDIFPSIFTDGDQMPETLRQHLRYPEDLFRVQSDMYNRYHVTDPRVFFTNGDPWAIARDPSTTTPAAIRDPGAYRDDQGPFTPMVPYYLLMRLPGDEELAFLMMQPFTPENRPNMVSFLVAKSGPTLEEFGQMIDFQLPRDVLTDGPGQVGARINQNPTVAREFTLLDQQGSEVIQGNMLVVPIEESVLYVQPVYISADAAATTAGTDATALPEFKFVIVVFGNTIVMEESIDLALTRIFGEGATPEPPPDDGEPPPDGEVPDTVADLIARANTLLEEADAALRDGDLATYAQKVQEAAALIQQANDLITGLEEPPPENGVETSG
jgi:hypothetical protein